VTSRYVRVLAGHGGRRLVCFPWSGAGALPFRSWGPIAPPDLTLLVARLGGREDRLREPCPTDWAQLIAELADELTMDQPSTFFGHCVGALMAFELAVELGRRGQPQPDRLVVVGTAPSRNADDPSPASARAAVAEVGTMSDEILNDPELFSIFEPTIAADLRLAEQYDYRPHHRIAVPVDVCVASAAGEAELAAAKAWSEVTDGPVTVLTVPGEKLYPRYAWLALAATVFESS
jgi:surfactin synthase thioesterase subunit